MKHYGVQSVVIFYKLLYNFQPVIIPFVPLVYVKRSLRSPLQINTVRRVGRNVKVNLPYKNARKSPTLPLNGKIVGIYFDLIVYTFKKCIIVKLIVNHHDDIERSY